MRVAVIVASVRRPEEIGQLLKHLVLQSQPPAEIVLSVEQMSDLPTEVPPDAHVVMGPKGLTKQRNRGLEKVLHSSDIAVFFDDDFLPADDALKNISDFFSAHPDIVAATGEVLSDGVKSGGFSYEAAQSTLQAFQKTSKPEKTVIVDTQDLYGCNMSIRLSQIGSCRFDENLPLYAWQEDVDFAGQLLVKGRVVKTNVFSGVHRGVNKGRSPGFALGYSQMINPAYLVSKGTMRPNKAARLMLKNFIANHIRAIYPESFIDRTGRVRGNWLGLRHLLMGKLDPTTILRL